LLNKTGIVFIYPLIVTLIEFLIIKIEDSLTDKIIGCLIKVILPLCFLLVSILLFARGVSNLALSIMVTAVFVICVIYMNCSS